MSYMVDSLVKDKMLDYSKYVLHQRMIPDYRDGLLPVQRRILYTMFENGAFSNAKFRKCAYFVGYTTGNYHPHGDCLDGNTEVLLLNGTKQKIMDLVKTNAGKKWVLAFDESSKKLVPAIAHSWRIGQITKRIYEITLSNGSTVTCTNNHPFMTSDGWVKAKNITEGTILLGGSISNEIYPTVYFNNSNGKKLHHIIGDSIYGGFDEDEVYHHINKNTLDNRPKNIKLIDKGDHACIHGDYIEGLANGRTTMFSEYSPIREKIRLKNSILMKEYNKNLPLLKAIQAIKLLKKSGKELTKKNYEQLRLFGYIYNLTKLETLQKKGITFDKLISLVDTFKIDTSKAKGLTQNKKEKVEHICDSQHPFYKASASVFRTMLDAIDVKDFNWHTYIKYASMQAQYNATKVQYANKKDIISKIGSNRFENFVKSIMPHNLIYVTKIVIKTLDKPKKMYDFTVDKYSNMVLPLDNGSFIIAHNSACFGALVTMTGTPLKNKIHFYGAGWQYPLIEGYGNFGSIDDPKSYAAMRYPESRLSVLSEMLFKLKPCIEYVDNYDNTKKEPLFLPSTFPFLLVNGVTGIAVGTTVDIPPHNMKEILDALIYMLDKKEVTLKKIMKFIKAPDYSYGGKIWDRKQVKEVYKNGTGVIQVGFNTEVQKSGRLWTIKLTGIPFKFVLKNYLEKLKHNKDIRSVKLLSNADKILVVIETTSEKEMEKIVNFKFSIRNNWNITIRNDEDKVEFKHTNLIDYLAMWLKYCIETHKKYFKLEMKRLAKEIRVEQIKILVCKNAEKVVKLIRKNDYDGVKALLKITDDELEIVKNMLLRSLSNLNEEKIKERIQNLQKEFDINKYNLNHTRKYLKKYFKEISKYSLERRTIIGKEKKDGK